MTLSFKNSNFININHIFVNNIDINKTGFKYKYFIGYKENKEIRPL